MGLKYVLIGAVMLAACALGGLWLFLRQVPPSTTMSEFQKTCIEGQRKSIAGDTLPLDDQTEARLLSYCDCVAQEVGSRLTSQDIAAIGLERASQALDAKLQAIFVLCRQRNP